MRSPRDALVPQDRMKPSCPLRPISVSLSDHEDSPGSTDELVQRDSRLMMLVMVLMMLMMLMMVLMMLAMMTMVVEGEIERVAGMT